jgi:soluble lytic murein transglycosylase
MDFLLGFFEYGAGGFIRTYLPDMEGRLSVPELRVLAAAMEKSGDYSGAISLVSSYSERKEYELNRTDLELSYPRPLRNLIEKQAGEAGLHPALLYGLIRTESAFQQDIVSRAGALGLTQLMPATAGEMAGRIKRQGGPDYTGGGGPDLKDPGVNVHIGAVYLSYLNSRMASPLLALLSYNGGMNRVRRWHEAENRVSAVPLPGDLFLETIEYTETREYGRKVLSAAAVYAYLYYDLSMKDFLADIYGQD